MKFQYSIQELLIFITLIAIAVAIPTHFWRKDKAKLEEAWGPNPGYVEFTAHYDGETISRKILVRDLNNAQEKVETEAYNPALMHNTFSVFLYKDVDECIQIAKEIKNKNGIKTKILKKEKLQNYPYWQDDIGVWHSWPVNYPRIGLAEQIGALVFILIAPYLMVLLYMRTPKTLATNEINT
jgi:hypothetical protein